MPEAKEFDNKKIRLNDKNKGESKSRINNHGALI
jgi:hypothetical protein